MAHKQKMVTTLDVGAAWMAVLAIASDEVAIPSWAFQVGGWVAGIGLILAGLVKLVPRFRSLYMDFRKSISSVDSEIKAKQDLQASLISIRRVTAIKGLMERWVIHRGAQRCLLLTANNGGEEWKAGGKLYVSNPAQAVGAGVPNTWQEWQGWRCDAWYTEFLGKLLESYEAKRGMLLICCDDVEGDLHDAYEHQGTVASVVLPFMWLSGSVLWYVFINFGRPWDNDRPKLQNGRPVLKEDGKPVIIPGNPITDEERAQFIANARELYQDQGRVRQLIDELRAAFNSIR